MINWFPPCYRLPKFPELPIYTLTPLHEFIFYNTCRAEVWCYKTIAVYSHCHLDKLPSWSSGAFIPSLTNAAPTLSTYFKSVEGGVSPNSSEKLRTVSSINAHCFFPTISNYLSIQTHLSFSAAKMVNQSSRWLISNFFIVTLEDLHWASRSLS